MCMVNRSLKEAIDKLYLDPSINNRGVRICAERGYHVALKKLLEDSRVDPTVPCPEYTVFFPNLEDSIGRDFLLNIYEWLLSPLIPGYPLRAAAMRGHQQIVKLLLEDSRCDPNSMTDFCIRTACRSGHTGIVKLLLQDKRANPAAIGNISLIAAILNGHEQIVQLLLQDPRVDPSDLTLARPDHVKAPIKALLLSDSRIPPQLRDILSG